jgi:glycosyltransferase 2 family protein
MKVRVGLLIKVGRLAALAAISAILLIVVLKNASALSELETSPDLPLLASSLLAMLLSYLGPATIWHVISRNSGAKVSYLESLHFWSVSQLGKYIPGAALVVLKRARQYKSRGLDWKAVLHGFLIENLVVADSAFLSAGLFGGLALLGGDRWMIIAPLILAASIMLLHPSITQKLLGRALKRNGLDEALIPFLSIPAMMALLSMGLLTFVLSGLGLHLLIRAMTGGAPVGIEAAVGAISGAGLANLFVIFTPAGLGTREFFLAALLSPAMPASIAVVIAAASRIIMTISELLLPSITWVALKVTGRRKRRHH